MPAKSFKARLERDGGTLNWVVARIPFRVEKVWGGRGRFRVKGDINGFAFRTSLFSRGESGHFLLVNKRMQAGAKAAVGAVARFRLEPDTETRVDVPAELGRYLSEDRALRRWFNQLSYSIRKGIGRWVTEVKSAEARERRAEQITERMIATMEAEIELPPILQMAIARNPRAHQGWKLMTPTQRRMHLLGIFYYREPAGQARRIAKAVEDAYKFADRASSRDNTSE